MFFGPVTTPCCKCHGVIVTFKCFFLVRNHRTEVQRTTIIIRFNSSFKILELLERKLYTGSRGEAPEAETSAAFKSCRKCRTYEVNTHEFCRSVVIITNITVKDHAEQFCVAAISPIRVVFHKKRRMLHRKF